MYKPTDPKFLKRISFLLFLLSITFLACKKDKVSNESDLQLFAIAEDTTDFVWYKFSDELLERSSGSGHSQPFLRTRYNAIAATQLDIDGKILEGAVFPEGSAIVKELIDNNSEIDLYAILYKDSSNDNADSNGWVWGYIGGDGVTNISSSEKGGACISCHSQSENIDYMLMNKFYP